MQAARRQPQGGCRYDDRNHWLFRTLHTKHNMDYHQACIKGATIEKGGEPRSSAAQKIRGCLAKHHG